MRSEVSAICPLFSLFWPFLAFTYRTAPHRSHYYKFTDTPCSSFFKKNKKKEISPFQSSFSFVDPRDKRKDSGFWSLLINDDEFYWHKKGGSCGVIIVCERRAIDISR